LLFNFSWWSLPKFALCFLEARSISYFFHLLVFTSQCLIIPHSSRFSKLIQWIWLLFGFLSINKLLMGILATWTWCTTFIRYYLIWVIRCNHFEINVAKICLFSFCLFFAKQRLKCHFFPHEYTFMMFFTNVPIVETINFWHRSTIWQVLQEYIVSETWVLQHQRHYPSKRL
jgi:hypothetical protein